MAADALEATGWVTAEDDAAYTVVCAEVGLAGRESVLACGGLVRAVADNVVVCFPEAARCHFEEGDTGHYDVHAVPLARVRERATGVGARSQVILVSLPIDDVLTFSAYDPSALTTEMTFTDRHTAQFPLASALVGLGAGSAEDEDIDGEVLGESPM